MPKLIHIEDVKLKSMSVEIKAMTVSGKQMTLAVFRQLPERNIWDDGYKLLGIPWGRVLYFWGSDKDCNGFQVVWQEQDTLYRSVHYIPRHKCLDYERKRDLENEMEDLKYKWRNGKPELKIYEKEIPDRLPSYHYPAEETLEEYKAKVLNETNRINENRIREYNDKIVEYQNYTLRYIEADNKVKEIEEMSARAFSAHERAYKDLEALPQLFIAL